MKSVYLQRAERTDKILIKGTHSADSSFEVDPSWVLGAPPLN